MIRADMVWAICSPENQNRWRAQAMRLAVRYADPGTAPEAVAELIPVGTKDHQMLLAAFAEGLTEFATHPIHGVTTADIWELVEKRATVVPADVSADVLTMVAEYADHGAEPTQFAARAITAGLDPRVAAHVSATIVGVLAGILDQVRHIDAAARKLDSPGAGERAPSS